MFIKVVTERVEQWLDTREIEAFGLVDRRDAGNPAGALDGAVILHFKSGHKVTYELEYEAAAVLYERVSDELNLERSE